MILRCTNPKLSLSVNSIVVNLSKNTIPRKKQLTIQSLPGLKDISENVLKLSDQFRV